MTDFYTAVRERENLIIQDTRKQLEYYQIELKNRDGVYRHLNCYDPRKGRECSFEVHSTPWTATILGDWCKAYTLKCEQPDMFIGFLNDDEPNINYWAEKVRNRTNLETTEYEFVKLCLFDWLDEWADEDIDAAMLDSCKYDLAEWIDIDDPFLIEHLSNWCFRYQDKDSGHLITAEPFYSFTFEDAFWDVWTEEWIRVCELLRWTACKVAAMEASKDGE